MLTLFNKTILKAGGIALFTATGTGIYFLVPNNNFKTTLNNVRTEESNINRIQEEIP